MPKNTAIICEFNPLHNGHKAILAHAKTMGDRVIAIMSGNFTQRSECAIFDKYKRAEAALRAGADAVFELPFPWCSSGGEFFALGGVGVAAGLGLESFVFGSETGDADRVRRAAEYIASDANSEALGEHEAGIGTATAHDKLLADQGLSLSSNDKLAAEYIRAAKKLGIDADFTAYKRMTDPETYRSATDLRGMLRDGGEVDSFIPEELCKIYGETPDGDIAKLRELLFNHFRLLDTPHEGIFDAEGGVAERLIGCAAEARSAEEFFTLAATKRYTNSRLRRAALFTLMGVTEDDVKTPPRFTVLLGANERGREFLSEIRRTSSIKVLTKPSAGMDDADESFARQYEMWKRADELYTLCMSNGVKKGEFLRRNAVIR